MNNDYYDMAEALLTALRVAKGQGADFELLARVLDRTIRRTIDVDDFYDIVRDIALDMDIIDEADE